MANQLLAGRYRQVRLLGEGAFGQVFEALDVELDRTVALKLLKAAMADKDVRARFEREARVTAGLNHPHVVTVFGHGVTEEGQAYLAYEFLEGYDLEAVVEGRRTADERTVLRWGFEVAQALQYAHEQGVVHRDVKPANVFLKGGVVPVLVDFGIARDETGATALTSEGAMLGSPAYMAPETWAGESPGPAADQFGWAVSVFELLYGQLPFLGNTPIEVFDRLQSGAPAAIPSGYQGRIPEVEAVLLRGLALQAADRYPTIGEFGEALKDAQRGSLARVRALSNSRSGGASVASEDLQELPTRAAASGRGSARAGLDAEVTVNSSFDLRVVRDGPVPHDEPVPRQRFSQLWMVLPLLVLAGFFAPSLRRVSPPVPSAPEPTLMRRSIRPSLRPLPTADRDDLLSSTAVQVEALTRAGADLLRFLGEDPGAALDDRTSRLTFQGTERIKGLDPNFYWLDRILSKHFLAVFGAYLEALGQWFRAVTNWSKTRPEAFMIWHQPEVRGTLEGQVFGVFAWALEVCRLMHTDGVYVSDDDPLAIPRVTRQVAQIRERLVLFLTDLKTLNGRPARPWFRGPLRSLGLTMVPGPGGGMTWDTGDQLEAMEALVVGFENTEPGFEAYTMARVAGYLLTFSVLDARLEWSARDEYVGRLGDRLLGEESPWQREGPQAARRQRLLVRVMAEEMRLRRVSEVDKITPPPDPVRARRVFKQAFLGIRNDPRGSWEGAYLAEALADTAGLPGLYNRERNKLVLSFRSDLRKLRDEAWALLDKEMKGHFYTSGRSKKKRRLLVKQGKLHRSGPGEFVRSAAPSTPGADD